MVRTPLGGQGGSIGVVDPRMSKFPLTPALVRPILRSENSVLLTSASSHSQSKPHPSHGIVTKKLRQLWPSLSTTHFTDPH